MNGPSVGAFEKPVSSGHQPEPWSDGIAIVGMSARYPRARNVQEFWERLVAGELLIAELSPEELRRNGVDEATLSSPDYVARGTTIEEAECLDAEFFGLSKREAEIIDPQQRVFLESAWEALEHAGYTGESERVGIFGGVGMNTYLLQLLNNPALLNSAGPYQLMLANDKDFLATRAAYKLNLRGPAVTVQTACSTSLAAVHLACQSLLAEECDMALAGGVSIPFPQNAGYMYMPGMILSKDGHCRPFDSQAGGTVPGRGSGIVVLKRLSRAVADGDTIYAVIRGSAWNNDGAGKVGYTVPSLDGQAEVIRAALHAAGVRADRLGFVEAHGTATELGDPIEFTALAGVFAEHQAQTGSCFLGAVKSNMGHADVASGVAGLIKAALAVHSAVVPPTLHFKSANAYIDFEGGPFVVNTTAIPWVGEERWAGVSSFGIGGTNVHVVLSSAPEKEPPPAQHGAQIFPVSAKTPSALTASSSRLADWLALHADAAGEDVASTLQMGRRKFAYRRAEVASTAADLIEALRQPSRKLDAHPLELGRDVVFLFPGQGQQFLGMAPALYREDRVFRSVIDEGAGILREEFGLHVTGLISGESLDGDLRAQLNETHLAQPVLFLLEYALASRWRSLGVEPSALLGHSLGELAAASVAGVFSFEDGVRLAAERGRLMANTAPGVMLAVTLPSEKLAAYLDQDVWLAAENSPRMSVASGLIDAVERLERRLMSDRIPFVRLASRNAFHTPLMAEAAVAFRQAVEKVTRQAPTIPWLSNVTGTWITAEAAQSSQYWGTQIFSRVRFNQNLGALADRPRLLVEVGPGEALIGIARQQLRTSITVASLGAENRKNSDLETFLKAAARVWECGVDLNWRALQPEASKRRIALPTYPFERQRYWVESRPAAATSVVEWVNGSGEAEPAEPATASVKRPDLSSWFSAPYWKSTPPPAMREGAEPSTVQSWMILMDEHGLGEKVATELRRSGVSVTCVQAGTSFMQREGFYAINPARLEDYDELWRAVTAQGLNPTGLINLWTVAAEGPSVYDSLVRVLQSAGLHRQRLRQIEVVTQGLESVAGEPIAGVGRAEIYGLLRVIPTEYAGTGCRSIDLHASMEELEPLASQIVAEVSVITGDRDVAYRGARRWVKDWSPAPLQAPGQDPFRAKGVYLVTGGLGGVGYSFARHLLQNFQARVVVTGREALPSRAEWSRLASEESQTALGRRVMRMQTLEAAGGEVRYIAANVADPGEMAGVLHEVIQRFQDLHGVLHAAGLPMGNMLAAQDLEEAERGRRPKVQGSMVLADLLQGRKLDFLIFCSSASAIVPGASQAAYAAANAFQNSFAEYCRQSLGLPATSIAFDAWQEVGMAAEMELPEGFESIKEERLRTAMRPEEGVEVIRRVAAQWGEAQIAATTISIQTLIAGMTALPDVGKESVETEPDTPGAELSSILAIWKDLLGHEEISPTDNFFELGGHSLLGTMVLARIRQRFGVVLTLRHLFEAPTPESLARVVQTSPREQNELVLTPAGGDEGREEFEI